MNNLQCWIYCFQTLDKWREIRCTQRNIMCIAFVFRFAGTYYRANCVLRLFSDLLAHIIVQTEDGSWSIHQNVRLCSIFRGYSRMCYSSCRLRTLFQLFNAKYVFRKVYKKIYMLAVYHIICQCCPSLGGFTRTTREEFGITTTRALLRKWHAASRAIISDEYRNENGSQRKRRY